MNEEKAISSNQRCRHPVLYVNDPVRWATVVVPCPYCERDRLHAALEQIQQETLLLSDSTALMCGQIARNALAGYHPLTADGSPFETKAPVRVYAANVVGDAFMLVDPTRLADAEKRNLELWVPYEDVKPLLSANGGAQETNSKPLFPPDEPWPSSLGEQCPQYWGRVERRCQLTQGHEPPCYFCVPSHAIRTDISLDPPPEKAPAEPKVGDEVTLHFTSSLVKSREGWKVDRIDRTEYFFLSDAHGSQITLLRGQFSVKAGGTP